MSALFRRLNYNYLLSNTASKINRDFTAGANNSNTERMTSFGFQQVSEKTKVEKGNV